MAPYDFSNTALPSRAAACGKQPRQLHHKNARFISCSSVEKMANDNSE
jgi:hypothetical protein